MENNILDNLRVIEEANERGVKLVLNNGILSANSDTKIDQDLLLKIKENKAGIIEYLQKFQGRDEIKKLPKITSYKYHSDKKIPLSFSQERLWFTDKLQGSIAYHIPIIFQLKGNLNIIALEKSLRSLLDRHEILRTIIRSEEGEGYQELISSNDWILKIAKIKNKKEIDNSISSYVKIPFDLSKDYMLRAKLYDLGEKEYILTIVIHHIATDGWSQKLIISDLVDLYNNFESKKGLRQSSLKYSDYALWQREQIEGEILNSQLNYWENKLKSVAPLDLPIDYARPSIQNTEGAIFKINLSNELSSSIDALCIQEDVTLFIFLLTTFKVLLLKYSGQEDICIGTPIANRTQSGLEDIVGFFVNTLALRSNLDKNASFKETLHSIKQSTLESYDNQLAPFEKIVDRVVDNRNMSITPIFQVMFSLQDESTNQEEFTLKKLTLKPYRYREDTSNFDLTLSIEKNKSDFSLNMEYCSALFKESTIEQMLNHYKELLKSIVNDINKDIDSLSILTNTEKEILINGFNTTDLLYPKDKSIVDVFSDQVKKTPKKTALVFDGKTMSYGVLDEESNKIANYLHAKNIKEGSHIGILFNRGFDMIVSMIGVLKAGCAYVPLDPSLPKNRLSFIIKDAKIQKIICEEKSLHSSLLVDENTFIDNDDLISSETSLLKVVKRNLNNTAYIMYTSGTTGTPKGILTTDENILTLIYNKDAIQIKSFDKVLQWSNYAFDGSTYEIYGSLLVGASLHLVKNSSASNIVDLSKTIQKDRLTIVFITTALFNSFVDHDVSALSNLRKLLFGGEKVSLNHVKKAYNNLGSNVLIHVYGPTETTTYATYHCVNSIPEKSYTIPIGKPLSNTQAYVLNANKNLVPVGVIGELYIGGTGLAKGYLNRDELTSERFITNPFKNGERLYRTGDLVRWQKDGTIEFVGRADNQVKIRGYRIELGEIENRLFNYKPILNCCVLPKEDVKSNKRLVGYVVTENDFDQEEAQDFLKESLPDYMIPNVWVKLDNIPLTSNGKINKKALPSPDMSNISTSEYVAPRNAREEQVTKVWQDVLGLDKIGIYDNFFKLGGHSLLIVKLIAELQKYGLYAEVRDIFSNPTISELSLKLEDDTASYTVPENRIEENCSSITPEMLPLIDFDQSALNTIMSVVPGGASNIQDIYPLAPLQEGIYFHYLMSGKDSGDVYVIPSLLSFSSLEKRDQFIEALSFVINRHDVLRTCILSDNIPHPVQVVLREVEFRPERIVLKGEQSIVEELQEIVELGKQRIDLSIAPLLQVKIAEDVEKGEYFALLNQHHIIVDHVSLEKITEEIFTYIEGNGNTLESPALYRNFIGHTLHQQATNNSEQYFKERFETIEEPTLPFGLHDIQGDGIDVLEASLSLSKSLSDKITQTANDLHMGPAAIFHAAFGLVVGVCSHRSEQVVFGTVLSGRLQGVAGSERSLGLFINTLPLVCNLNTNILDYLNQVQGELSGLLPYEQTSLTSIQGWSNVDRHLPLFSGILNYRHSKKDDDSETIITGLEVLLGKERTNYPFSLNIDDFGKEEEFVLTMQVHEKLDPRRILSYLENALHQIIDNISNDVLKVADLSIVSSGEEDTLLNVFNNTQQNYPTDLTLVDLFELQVQKTPEAIAVVFEEEKLTYNDLNKRANQLANYLINKGATSEDLIGISLDRSINMLIGVLGILKSGSAYVPIDPSLPKDRIDYIIEDSEINLLITTQDKSSIFVSIFQVQIISIDTQWNILDKESIENLPNLSKPSQLAYVIYTSGSTGKPKGVMNEHRGVVNRLLWTQSQYNLTSEDVILQKTSFSFDVSVWELFWANQCGATLVFAKPEGHKDARYLKEIIESQKITTIHFVPSMLRVFLSEVSLGDCSSLRRVICSGEALKLDDAIIFKEKFKNVDLENLYGPTEAAIDVTSWSVPLESDLDKILIGKPVANTQLYVLNSSEKLLPIGAVGELCIGGVQVARGYLNNETLTREKFVENPFKKGERLYKTGDLARWLPDGTIDFIGRLDDQVKIRGYRVELGEIESVLLQKSNIENCCVLAKKDSLGSDRLVGYAVGDTLDKEELQDFLRDTLPDYMVPRIWVFLDTMPLSNSGKIAKRSLPDPEIGDLSTSEYVAPASSEEIQLATIWKELLNLDKIGLNDNFFELGGHSILVTRLVSRISQSFHIKISLKDIFDNSTLYDLANLIANTKPEEVYAEVQKAPLQEDYDVSHAQKRMWILNKLDENKANYNIPHAIQLIGDIDVNIFNEAIQAVINKHEILRTLFITKNGLPRQKVLNSYEYQIDFLDLNKKENIEQKAKELAKKHASIIFDLEKKPPFEIKLLKLEDKKFVFLFNLHHIISDGWSNQILLKEIINNYDSLNENGAIEDRLLKIQYKDYAYWQNNLLNPQNSAVLRNYWSTKFSGEITSLELPLDRSRASSKEISVGGVKEKLLSKSLYTKVKNYAKKNNTTLFTVLITVVKTLLHRYTGQSDIVIGTPVSGRDHIDLEDQIGFYVNTLAIRSDIKGDSSFDATLSEVKNNLLQAYDHQLYPFNKLVEDLNIEPSENRNPIFDVMVTIEENQNFGEKLQSNYFEIDEFEQNYVSDKFDLLFGFFEEKDSLILRVDYKSNLFNIEKIERLLLHFEQIAIQCISNSELAINNVNYLNEEQQIQLNSFKGDVIINKEWKSVVDEFTKQVYKTPNAIALVDDEKSYTYLEVHEKSNKIANFLLSEHNIRANEIVGILCDRTASYVFNILGILKSGGAYLPLEKTFTDEYIDSLLNQTKSRFVLTDNETKGSNTKNVFFIEITDEILKNYDIDLLNINNEITLNSLAYVMFTSGTTGTPKGVMINNLNIIRLVKDTNYIQLSNNDRILQTGSLSFDASTFEIWGSLLNGLQLHLIKLDNLLDVTSLQNAILERGITKIFITTAWFNQLVDIKVSLFKSLKQVLVGGERLSPTHIEKVKKENPKLILTNCYGPTENTTFSICGEIRPNDINNNIPLGYPITNTSVYILDKNQLPVPVGVSGEIYLGGLGVASGYLNNQEKTAESFIKPLFIEEPLLYKTGDLARWMDDGRIAFHGRIDDQLKIRGYRIEMSGILSVARQYSAVKDVEIVALKLPNNSDKDIVMYYTSTKSLNEDKLKQHFKNELPNYMLPTYFVRMKTMPLNKNGKVDKKKLPEPIIKTSNKDNYTAPSSLIEETVIKLLSKLLGLNENHISTTANFFELGVHSLKAIALVAQINEELKIDIPYSKLFSFATIKEFSSYIENKEQSDEIIIEKAPVKDLYPASSAQKRIYTLYKMNPNSLAYNIPGTIVFSKKYSKNQIEKACNSLIARHESLRTSFVMKDGEVFQKINQKTSIFLEVIYEKELQRALLNFVKPFNLDKGPLIRVAYLENERTLLLDIHHSITDGTSQEIIQQELIDLLDKKELKPVSYQFKDYTEWLYLPKQQERLKQQQVYWKNRLSGEIPDLKLPLDFERTTLQNHEGKKIQFKLNSKDVTFLKELSNKQNTTIYTSLLSVWSILLSKLGSVEDLVIGTPVLGRTNQKIMDTVGMFVNTVPVRLEPKGNETFVTYLKQVKQNTLNDFEHQEYPLEDILDTINYLTNIHRNPLFDTMFSIVTEEYSTFDTSNITTTGIISSKESGSKFDINLAVADLGDEIVCSLDYKTSLFEDITIQRIVERLHKILNIFKENPTIKISHVEVLLTSELEEIIEKVNDTKVVFENKNKTIDHLFSEICRRHPNKLGVADAKNSLSLSDLEERATQLASHIISKGFENSLIAIYMEPSIDVIISILAIFKSGSAYVPIDTELPMGRIEYILQDSGAICILSPKKYQKEINFKGSWIDTDDQTSWTFTSKLENSLNSSENLAYIIYTSGSTGKPKGVRILQYQLINYVQWFTQQLNYTHKDNSVLLSSFAFDLGHSSVFPALACGGGLHILKKEEYLNIDYLNSYLNKEKITFIKCTPTLFSLIINDPCFNQNSLINLRHLMLGGESIIYKDIAIFFDYYPDKKIINHYGPTEATIGCIVKPLSKDNYYEVQESLIIGRPIANMNAYILDKYLKPVAPGVLGELFLSGISISEGYHDNPYLTKEKFIANPFIDGKTMYATGDLASWSMNYEIEFKGRIDDQLKIRGYRVELGEIIKVIDKIDFVQKSTILIIQENSQKSLVAFVESKEADKVDNNLRAILEKSLPSYMIPSHIIPIDKIPTTANGKIDKKTLAKLIENNKQEVELPKSKTEQLISQLWSDVLNIKHNNIDINANFFSLGGHSLKALKLIGKIEKQLRKKILLKDFFTNPTIKAIAKELDNSNEVSYTNIISTPEKPSYPLSHSQKRMWMLQEFSEDKVAYNVPRAFKLKGNLDVKAIYKAFEYIFNRHEILRTTFKEVKGEPQQFITPISEFKIPIEFEDLSIEEKELETFISKVSNIPFNLSQGPLVSIRVYKRNDVEYILFLNLHHIISDGWSATILLNELCFYYNAIVASEEFTIPDLTIQYKDYAVWQQQEFKKESFKNHKTFWKNKLSGDLKRFSLPTTYPKTKTTKNQGKSLTHLIDKDLTNKLTLKATELEASFYMLLLASFKTLAYRYTLQKDIIIGTIVAGREKEELANQLGFYVNTIAQRTLINGELSFAELLQTLKNDLLETVVHQYYPFDQVVKDLGITKSEYNSPFFDVMFVHQNNEELDKSVMLSGLDVAVLESSLSESKFDVSFVTKETSEGLQVFVEYNGALYSDEFLKQFLKHYEVLLRSIENNIDIPIDQLSYLQEEEELAHFNDTSISKNYSTIHEIIEQKVSEQPNRIALVTENSSLTYLELNEKANALANYIQDKYHPEPDTIIAFTMVRSEWQIISMLAILKVGAAFLPIDVNIPDNRKNIILEDATPMFVICDDTFLSKKQVLRLEHLNTLKEVLPNYPVKNLNKSLNCSSLAYVVYTSGSTGKPKGVLIEHRGNINMVTDQVKQLEITQEDNCLQFASISFDASIYEIFIALYSGSSLVLITDEIIANPLEFANYIAAKEVTFATLPPAYLSTLDKTKLTTLQTIVTAGETPNYTDAKYFSRKINYFNAYGPTEYSVCATLYKVTGNEKVIPIGKPLENTKIYILDDNMNVMPIGSWGEIYLSGDGIARGYIDRPKQNKEVFLNNPFESMSKLYKTGDIGRWLKDGNIEFSSRLGDMIKIRGYRVEKGEIVSTLLMNSNIKEAVITFNEQQQNLTAYIVNENVISTEEVKKYLAAELPMYMVPTFIIHLDQIPLTTNGKVDYKALEIISEEEKEFLTETEFLQPENEIENKLLTIWKDILEIDFISTKDNFFEIGGQSITAMKLIGTIWKSFNEEIKLKDFLQNPTIKDLSNFLQDSRSKTQSLIVSFNDMEDKIANLFMIPPILGTSMIFRSLSERFSKEKIASYGVQYKGFDSDETLDTSILDMVKNMVDEIMPYLNKDKQNVVLGYSMGALLAVEVVAEIEKQGYKTKLILMDKTPEHPTLDTLISDVVLEGELEIEEIVNNHLQDVALPDFSKNRVTKLVRNNVKLLTNYKGFKGKIESEILALEAKEKGKKNSMLGWEKITNGNLSHSVLEGDHYTILNNENQILQVILEFINQNN